MVNMGNIVSDSFLRCDAMTGKSVLTTGLHLLFVTFVVALGTFAWAASGDAEYFTIPYDVDPPIVVDAQLSDWTDITSELDVERPDQVTWGSDQWKGTKDLSGKFRLAWRSGGFALAAFVRDDVIKQPFQADEMWKGDHINLFFDFVPGQEPERNFWGNGQYQIGFSPGKLVDSQTATAEAVLFYPEGFSHGGKIEAVVRRLKTGYVIEAHIPMSVLGDRTITQGDDFNFTVAISDADNEPVSQESWMTLGTKEWLSRRDRLLPAVLGDGSGKATVRPRVVKLDQQFSMQPGDEPHVISFDIPTLPAKRDAHVFFRGRVDYPKVGGHVSGALQLLVNGTRLAADRLSNRSASSVMRDGRSATFVSPDGRIVLWYAPNFADVDSDPYYQLIDGVKGCEYEFRITDLLKAGANQLTLEYLAAKLPDTDRIGHFGDVELRFRAPEKATEYEPAPTGEIAVYQPRKPSRKTYRQSVRPGEIRLQAGREPLIVASRFSTPDGHWHQGSNHFFNHERKVIEHTEFLEVRDTFINLTDENVPVIQEHQCDLGQRFDKVWLSGVWMPAGQGNRTDPENPSIYVTTERAGLGMIAINDEFRVHHANYASQAEGLARISDRSFVLRPGAEYTSVLYLVPTAEPDFWKFINAARRAMDVNFTLDQCFTLVFHQEPIYVWTDQQLERFVRMKSSNFVVQSNEASRYKGRYAYARGFLAVSRQPYIDFHKRIHQLFPDGDVRHGVYYHCFIDNFDDGDDSQFAEDRLLDAAGNHVNYGGAHAVDKIYVPTLENSFGRETEKVVDSLLDEIEVDGVFWDEWTHSRVQYTYNENIWDGCSADIDPDSLKITRLKSSLALATLPWRVKQMKKMLAHGPVMTNGSPHTHTMQELRAQGFTETGTLSYCRQMLLYSPIGLGDHLTVRTQKDAYQSMVRQLDHGCLFAWYSHQVVPTHKTLTEHMFPFTPVELHEGYMIGEERILTNRSGYFGWGDQSQFDAYVYDRDGRLSDAIEVPVYQQDGITYAEVRIPEGYTTAIVRR